MGRPTPTTRRTFEGVVPKFVVKMTKAIGADLRSFCSITIVVVAVAVVVVVGAAVVVVVVVVVALLLLLTLTNGVDVVGVGVECSSEAVA